MAEAPREQGLHQLVRYVGVSQAVQPALNLSISVLVARTLGPEGRGAYGLLNATLAVLPLVVGFGLVQAVRYWAARGETDRPALLKTLTLLGAGAGVLGAASVYGSWSGGVDWFVPPGVGPAAAIGFALVLFLAVLRGFWMNYLAGLERYGYQTWGVNASLAVQAVALVALWKVDEISVDGLVLVLAAQFGFAFGLFVVVARGELLQALRSPLLSGPEMTGMLRYGGWQYASSLLMQTNMRANIFLLNGLGGLYETGLYTAVSGPAGFLALIASPFNMVLTARTARRHDDPTFPARVVGGMRLMVLLMIAAAGVGAALAPAALPWILGEEFRAAVRPFWILLPGVIAYTLVLTIAQYLQGAKRPQLNTLVSGVGAVLTVVLNLVLIPRFGADGAAVAFTATFLVAACVALWAFLGVSGLGWRELLAFRTSDWAPLGRVVGFPPRR